MQPVRGLEGKLRTALTKFQHARAVVSATETQWEPAFFGGERLSERDLVALEAERLRNRAAYNETRRHFAFLRRQDAIPAVRWEISTPVELANESAYGLGGLVFTRDIARAHRVARQLDVGTVGINAFAPMPPSAPFGGVKQSGLGREGSRHGMAEFMEMKYLCLSI